MKLKPMKFWYSKSVSQELMRAYLKSKGVETIEKEPSALLLWKICKVVGIDPHRTNANGFSCAAASAAFATWIKRGAETGPALLRIINTCKLRNMLDRHQSERKRTIRKEMQKERRFYADMPQRTIPARGFYRSREWQIARYEALKDAAGQCMLCGATAGEGAVLHVDHVLPRSLFPHLALKPENLQVLCALCNFGKTNTGLMNWKALFLADRYAAVAMKEGERVEARADIAAMREGNRRP